MHPNAELIQKFYTAFRARDAAGMCACYHPDVVFSDPVFGRLPAAEAIAMWHMLCGRAKDLQITFRDIQAKAETGAAHWEAQYTFGKKSRPVHNVIEATFVFRENLIVQHDDTFDLWHWTRMALGPPGRCWVGRPGGTRLLGKMRGGVWTLLFRNCGAEYSEERKIPNE